ncbi:MAG: LptF/LptG family permease [Gemmatimonadales bacterium]
MRLINRYVLKEHVAPFLFALSTLTSLMLLQYIARKFGDLVGRGLSWQVVGEFFVLSIPFTVALTLPMAVLVAVLYAFSRLAAENEVTALKAGGISTRSLLWPALGASAILALFMLWFNDQVLSSANHELAALQMAIVRTKPTFALKEQVINAVKEQQLYLRAGGIDRDQSGRIRDVTIYDVANPANRRTIYADSGTLAFAMNHRDLVMHLFSGMMMTAPANQPAQLERVYFTQDELKVRDVANSFQSVDADTASKGEREMSICEMQKEYAQRRVPTERARDASIVAGCRTRHAAGNRNEPEPKPRKVVAPRGIGAVYCDFITKYLHVKAAAAAELPVRAVTVAASQDTTKRDSLRKDTTQRSIAPMLGQDTTSKGKAAAPAVAPAVPATTPGTPGTAGTPINVQPPPARSLAEAESNGPAASDASYELTEATIRLQDARHWRNRFGVEIQKKFSLAAACIVFVIVGAPIALRFPRGGVGLVIGVSFLIFAIYYVWLTVGESFADKNIISPGLAMWGDNVLFLVIGLAFVSRMGHERVTGRGGGIAETMDATRAWFARQRQRAAPRGEA